MAAKRKSTPKKKSAKKTSAKKPVVAKKKSPAKKPAPKAVAKKAPRPAAKSDRNLDAPNFPDCMNRNNSRMLKPGDQTPRSLGECVIRAAEACVEMVFF